MSKRKHWFGLEVSEGFCGIPAHVIENIISTPSQDNEPSISTMYRHARHSKPEHVPHAVHSKFSLLVKLQEAAGSCIRLSSTLLHPHT